MAQYISFLKDFNYQLRHLSGVCNQADVLSRRPDHNNRSEDNDQVVALPDKVFVRAISTADLDKKIKW